LSYLACLDDEWKYNEVSKEEEDKISQLYTEHRLPPTWKIRGQEIVTTTIVGFTDKPLPPQVRKLLRPKITSWDELKDAVRKQAWYQRTHPQDVPRTTSATRQLSLSQ
jgi:hypothetical protein